MSTQIPYLPQALAIFFDLCAAVAAVAVVLRVKHAREAEILDDAAKVARLVVTRAVSQLPPAATFDDLVRVAWSLLAAVAPDLVAAAMAAKGVAGRDYLDLLLKVTIHDLTGLTQRSPWDLPNDPGASATTIARTPPIPPSQGAEEPLHASLPSSEPTRRGVIVGGLAAATSALVAACTGPQPASDAGTPAAWAVIGRVLEWCRHEVTSVQSSGFPAPIPALCAVALRAIDGAESSITAYLAAVRPGQTPFAAVCDAVSPAIVAVVDAVVGVVEALTLAHVPVPPSLVVGVEAAAGIVTRLAGVACGLVGSLPRSAAPIEHMQTTSSGYTPGTSPYVSDWLEAHGVPLQTVPPSLQCPVLR